jgi:hypothetical protein
VGLFSTALRWFFRGLIVVFLLLELAMFAAALLAPDILMGGDDPQTTRWGLGAGAVIMFAITLASWPRKTALDELSEGIDKQVRGKRDRQEWVMRAGMPASAVIVARQNEQPDDGDLNADLTLEIRIAGRAPYHVAYFWYEPEEHAAERMRLGRVLEAQVDPVDPSFVVVHWGDDRWYTTRRL